MENNTNVYLARKESDITNDSQITSCDVTLHAFFVENSISVSMLEHSHMENIINFNLTETSTGFVSDTVVLDKKNMQISKVEQILF